MGYEKDEKPMVLSYPAGINQSAYWRMHWPTYQLMVMEKMRFNIAFNFLRDSVPYQISSVVQIQRITREADANMLEKICTLKSLLDFRLIYDTDDILFKEDVPDFHARPSDPKFFNKEATIKAMNLCDEIVVSTPFLKEYYIQKGIQSEFTVIPNMIPYFWAGNYCYEEKILENYRKHKKKPRILYAGGYSHIHYNGKTGNDDFSHVIDAIMSTMDEFEWVFMGVRPWELVYSKTDCEFHQFVRIDKYPKKVASLECQMMIAPLADCLFNHGRTDVKFQEACSHGMPFAGQDITPFKHCPIRFDTGEKMLEVIRETLKDEESYIKASREGRAMIDKKWLELPENTALYEELFLYPYGDKRRVHINTINEFTR